MSLFVVLEGGEGCGKSTQARALYRRLSRLGIPTVKTHEPGGTPLGSRIRRRLKWGQGVAPSTELLLFAASRAHLVAEVIRPSLEQGGVVICDRYAASTTAYQGYGRGLDLNVIEVINSTATRGLRPDLTVLLDVPVEQGLSRKGSAGGDRFEQEEIAFHRRVREGYLKMAADDPQRWLIIDATQPPKQVENILWERVSQLLHSRNTGHPSP